jgi:hypothetical protein
MGTSCYWQQTAHIMCACQLQRQRHGWLHAAGNNTSAHLSVTSPTWLCPLSAGTKTNQSVATRRYHPVPHSYCTLRASPFLSNYPSSLFMDAAQGSPPVQHIPPTSSACLPQDGGSITHSYVRYVSPLTTCAHRSQQQAVTTQTTQLFSGAAR